MIGCRRGRWTVVSAGAVIVATLVTGCAGAQAPEADFDEARAANLAYKSAVAEVQKQLFDGEWRVWEYGDIPERCEDGYEFFLRRKLPEGFSFDGEGPQRMADLRAWMTGNGWQVAPSPSYGEGIDNMVIMAGKPEAKVSRLDVDFLPGSAAEGTVDVLELRATSTCEPGDAAALLEQLHGPFRAVPEDTGIPNLESPDATPLFERYAEG